MMTPAALQAALEARRAAIQDAWLAARPAPGSPEAAMWLAAYSVATGRCMRAFVWLHHAQPQPARKG
jgi:hypothetical protein